MTPNSTFIKPADGGLIYAETNLQNLFPEPLNTITSGFFFFLAIYWIVKLKVYSPDHAFLSVSSWLLLIGSVGGTVYHGLRKYPIFIPMDWVPILLLCLMASIWFWTKVLGSPILGITNILVLFLIQYPLTLLNQNNFAHLVMNINYALMGLSVILPLIFYLVKIRFLHYQWVVAAIISFAAALFFRIADGWGWVPFGTHFLWHVFGAAATAFMFLFIYRLNRY